jgi:hypothetical protein
MTEKHFEAISWCIENGIKVYVNPTKKGLSVQINDNGQIVQSPETYTKKQADLKVWALYLYLYETKSD